MARKSGRCRLSGRGGGKGCKVSRGPGAARSRKAAGRRAAQATGGARKLTVRVKTAKGRKLSSTRWLQRQLNDPYVIAAQQDGYRSRAAYKLMEIDDRFSLLQPGRRVVDLGAAPGGWAQVAAERVRSATADQGGKGGQVIAFDLVPIEPIAGVQVVTGDFTDATAPEQILAHLAGQRAHVVLSDMAAPATGHRQTDHLRIMGLAELALDFARAVLLPGGHFLAKVLQGGSEREILTVMKRDFASVRHVKPQASRAESAELYVLAMGFRAAAVGNEAG